MHIDLNDLRGGSAGSVLERSWTPAMAAAGPGSVYLTGPAAEAAACDAALTPMVTGQIDWAVLDQLTTVWLTAHDHGHTGSPPHDHPAGPQDDQPEDHADRPRDDQPDSRPEDQADGPRDDQADGRPEDHPDGPRDEQADDRTPGRRPAPRPVPFPGTGHGPGPGETPAAGDHDRGIAGCLEATRQRLQATILRWSLDLLSGPGGLASQLRGILLGAPFSTPGQPLDLGRTTRTIPPRLRTAVIQRDQHCVFPGCTPPPSVCDVHHLIPWAKAAPPAWPSSEHENGCRHGNGSDSGKPHGRRPHGERNRGVSWADIPWLTRDLPHANPGHGSVTGRRM